MVKPTKPPSYPYVPKYANGPFKYNKFHKPKPYGMSKHMGPFEPGSKPFHPNRFPNYKFKKTLISNVDYQNDPQLAASLGQHPSFAFANLNNKSMTLADPQGQQSPFVKKIPNYRLIGRNIFDPTVKNQFMKPRKKANTYYSRFLKQHPANNLPLAFQKSMSLAEDKALEEKEKQHKKDKKKKHKKNVSDSEREYNSSDSDSDSDSSKESENTDSLKYTNKKSHKFYSDISSDSDIEVTMKKKSKKKKKKKKQSKNKKEASKSSSESESNFNDSSSMSKAANKYLGDLSDYDSDDSMMDLKENLKPIGDYIKNREQMLNEMLRCLKGSKLTAMLPDVLKDKPFHLIKAKCMEELEIMSKKRIRCLLQGKEMTSSSGTDESSDDCNYENKTVQEDSNKKIFSPPSKFKPINAVKTDSDDKADKNVDDNECSQESNQDRGNSTTNADSQQQPQQQNGFLAAGFKRFVKKSISIKLKTVDSSLSNKIDTIKPIESNINSFNRKIENESSATKITNNQPLLNEDMYCYDIDSDDYNDVRKELDSILELESSAKDNRKYQEHNEFNYYNQEINTAESSCDYNYDLEDDLSNLDSEIEHNINQKHKSHAAASETSSYCSTCSEDEYQQKHFVEDNLSVSSSCSSRHSSIKKIVKGNKKNNTNNKKKHNKRKSKAKPEPYQSDSENNVDIEYIKETLKNILEMHIRNVSEDEDTEMKDILMSLLNEITDNESITLEECAFIHEKVNQLFSEDITESENILPTKNEKNVLSKSKDKSVNSSQSKSKKRKRKEKSSENLQEKRKRVSKRDKEYSEYDMHYPNKKKHDYEYNSGNDYYYNGQGEMMEAGEIDDMYDDEFIVEKELENLLKKNKEQMI